MRIRDFHFLAGWLAVFFIFRLLLAFQPQLRYTRLLHSQAPNSQVASRVVRELKSQHIALTKSSEKRRSRWWWYEANCMRFLVIFFRIFFEKLELAEGFDRECPFCHASRAFCRGSFVVNETTPPETSHLFSSVLLSSHPIDRSSFRYSRRQQKKRKRQRSKRKEEEKNKVWIIHLIWNLSSYFDFSPLCCLVSSSLLLLLHFSFRLHFFHFFFHRQLQHYFVASHTQHTTIFFSSLCFLVRRFIGGLRSNVSFGCVSHAFDFFSAFGFWSSSSFLFATLPPSSRCLLAIERANVVHIFSFDSPFLLHTQFSKLENLFQLKAAMFWKYFFFSSLWHFFSFHIQARFQAIFFSYTLRFSMKWAVWWREVRFILFSCEILS